MKAFLRKAEVILVSTCIRRHRPLAVRDADAVDATGDEYAPGIAQRAERSLRILEDIEEVLAVNDRHALVRERQPLSQVELEIGISIEVDVDPTRLPVPAAPEMQLERRIDHHRTRAADRAE